MNIFEIVGQNFFAPLASKHRQIYVDCLEIILDACDAELAYSVDRELIIEKLIPYFETTSQIEIQFDNEEEILRDSRSKAYSVLRSLEHYGWIEINADYKQTSISIFDQSIAILKTLRSITNQEETEYRTEISQIYATLTNPEFRLHPYSLIIEPVAKRTDDLISGLKMLNTSIKKYVNQMMEKVTFNDVIDNFELYITSNVSDAYHRLTTSENVSKYRIAIIDSLREIRSDKELFAKAVSEYMEQKKVDEFTAREEIQEIIFHTLAVFNSYDELIEEIERKNTRYIQSAADRIRFLNLNTNDVETRISTVLQVWQNELNEKEKEDYYAYLPEEYCSVFNLYPQNFINDNSLYTVPVSRANIEVEKIATVPTLSDEEKMMKTAAAHALIDSDFNIKKVNNFVFEKLGTNNKIKASEIMIEDKKEFMKLLYSLLFAKNSGAKYQIHMIDKPTTKCGWKFRDFEIKKKS